MSASLPGELIEVFERSVTAEYVTIDDDGPGVNEDERERIFEPGVRGHGSNGNGGAGLGLALSRRLARTVHGDVRAEPSAAGGRFVIRLPAA